MQLCSPNMAVEYFKPDNPIEIYKVALTKNLLNVIDIFKHDVLVIKSTDPDILRLNYVNYDLTTESEKVQNAVLTEYRKQSYCVQYTSDAKDEIELSVLNKIPIVVVAE